MLHSDSEETLSPRARLASLGLVLPAVSPPKGEYVPAVLSGHLVFVAGQVPMTDGELTTTGRLGDEVSIERGRELSRQCALAALTAVDSVVGLDRVTRVLKVTGYVASARGFLDQEKVVEGADELFFEVFGAAGGHARSVVGVADLPLGSPVEIETLFEVDR
ncbi:RidA family protein [Streptomyces sp. NPDC004051]